MPSETATPAPGPELPRLWGARADPPYALLAAEQAAYHTDSGAIVRRDARSGRELWRYAPAEAAAWGYIAVDAHRIVVSGVLMSGAKQPVVMALGADDGKLLWLRRLDFSVEVRLVGSAVALTEESGIRSMALDSQSGTELTPRLEGAGASGGRSGLDSDAVDLPAQILDVRGSVLLTLHEEGGRAVVAGWSVAQPSTTVPLWRATLEFGEVPGVYEPNTGMLLTSSRGKSRIMRFDAQGKRTRDEVLACRQARLRSVFLPSGAAAALLRDCSGTELVLDDGEVRWRYDSEGEGIVLIEGERAEQDWPTSVYEFHWLDEAGRLRQRQRIPRATTVGVRPLPDGLLTAYVERVAMFNRDESLRWSFTTESYAVKNPWLFLGKPNTQALSIADLATGRVRASVEAEQCLGVVPGAPAVVVCAGSTPSEVFGCSLPAEDADTTI